MKYADILPFVKEENLAFKEFFKHSEDTELPEDGFMWLFEHDICSLTCLQARDLYEELALLTEDKEKRNWYEGVMCTLVMFESTPYPAEYGDCLLGHFLELLDLRQKKAEFQIVRGVGGGLHRPALKDPCGIT